MRHPGSVESLVGHVSRQVRFRRAEHWALRGGFWGSSAAVVVLLVKALLGPWALPIAVGLVLAGALAGAAYGFTRRVTQADAGRLADRAFGLQERITTALEWARRPDRTPLVDALLRDAATRVAELPRRRVVARILPKEGRALPVPLAMAIVLALAPPLPLPSAQLPAFSPVAERDEAEDRTTTAMLQERSTPAGREPLKRPNFEERDFDQGSVAGGAATTGDLSAIFKDTALATQRPDFNSFLKKGDERLRLLEQTDRLPDLQSDFTTSQYKMMFRKSKALFGGLSPDISPDKLRELLEEMERLGRKGGNWGSDVGEGMDALEYGNHDRALEAMEKALNKMRAMEEQQRAGKGLRGGRETDRGSRGRDGRGGGEGDDLDFGEGEGLMPGKGVSGMPKGDPSQRLRATPYDVGIEGDTRKGRKESYDTNMTGRAGSMSSRLQYLGLIGRYRKMMEDAITREQIPRDYHDQIRDYFQALDER